MKPPSKKKPSRIPILLSTFICPGAGQLLQRRWRTGVVFMLGFFTAFAWVMTLALQNIIGYYRLAFEFDTYEPEPVGILNLLPAFGIALLIYLANVIDVFIAQNRIHSKQVREDFLRQNNLNTPG